MHKHSSSKPNLIRNTGGKKIYSKCERYLTDIWCNNYKRHDWRKIEF